MVSTFSVLDFQAGSHEIDVPQVSLGHHDFYEGLQVVRIGISCVHVVGSFLLKCYCQARK